MSEGEKDDLIERLMMGLPVEPSTDDICAADACMSEAAYHIANLTNELEATKAQLKEHAMWYLALDQQATEAIERAVKAEKERDEALSRAEAATAGQPMQMAPKDGTFILAVVAPNTSRFMEHQAGRVFAIRHQGITDGGYDMGWSVYPGYGGADDAMFACWCPVPEALLAALKTGAPHE